MPRPDFWYWLSQYNIFCRFEELQRHHHMKRCSQDYGKIYQFVERRMTLTESQKFCHEMTGKPAYSDLVVFGSCGEYLFVQSFLLDIAKNRRDLWDLEDGSRRLEIWTNSDRIPAKSQPERGRISKRSTDSPTDSQEELVEDETDVSGCSTNNTFAGPSDSESHSNSTDDSHRNLTTSFRAWNSNDETEVRYPMCQMRFDHSFWESGKWKFEQDDDHTVPTTTANPTTTQGIVTVVPVAARLERIQIAENTTEMATSPEIPTATTATEPSLETEATVTTSTTIDFTTTSQVPTEEETQTPTVSTTDVAETVPTDGEIIIDEVSSSSSTEEPSNSTTEASETEPSSTEAATSSTIPVTKMISPKPTNISMRSSTPPPSSEHDVNSSLASDIPTESPTTTRVSDTLQQEDFMSDVNELTTESPPHDSIYDDANTRIQSLKRQMQRPEVGMVIPGTGAKAELPQPMPQPQEVMDQCNEIATELVTHWKSDGDTSGTDVQAFITCMKSLHEVVSDALRPEMTPEAGGNYNPSGGAAALPSDRRATMVQHAITFSRLAVDGFSNLLKKGDPWSKLDHSNRSKSAISMVDQVHQLSFTLGCMLSDEHHQIAEENIILEVFGVESGMIRSNFSFPQMDNETSVKKQTEVRFTADVPVRRNGCGRHVATGIIYHNLATHMLPPEQTKVLMNSQLVSFSLSNSTESIDLENGSKVLIIFRHLKPLRFGDRSRCVFWDVVHQNWSRHRCERLDDLSSRNQTVCQCDHLTNFAVLMDISSREEDDGVKHLMTTICSSMSIACLSLTIVCLVFVKSLRNRRSIITANLSACLLVSNLLVVFGFDQTEDLLLCRVVSGLTLYSLLSAFMWMLMEGYLLYQMIILVFRSVGHLNTLTIYSIAYIPPAVVLGVFIGVTGEEGLFDPEYAYFCWISNSNKSSYIWSFAGPALAIVLVNAVILTKSFIAAVESQNKKKPASSSSTTSDPRSNPGSKSRLQNIRRWLKGWTSLLILVGLTWITGVLYIHESVSWFSYLFICLNGLQGVLIFVFEILLNSKTRKSLISVLRLKIPNASKYLTSLSKTSSHNLSNASKTTRCSNMTTSPTGSQSNLSRNIIAGSSCTLDFCAHVVTEPDGKDFSPHHLFHHHHEVPKLVMQEKFTRQPEDSM